MQEQSKENRGGARARKGGWDVQKRQSVPRHFAKGKVRGRQNTENAISGCQSVVGTVGRANFRCQAFLLRSCWSSGLLCEAMIVGHDPRFWHSRLLTESMV